MKIIGFGELVKKGNDESIKVFVNGILDGKIIIHGDGRECSFEFSPINENSVLSAEESETLPEILKNLFWQIQFA